MQCRPYKGKTPEAYNPRVNGAGLYDEADDDATNFYCGKFVGGFTDLDKLRETKKLWEALAECTGENDPRRQG
ncbi:hypothetical protein OESDEN_19243 [Oesophagostomum dentatum]|uniref:Uncharacterized protein n=1 Tax=Oesophagostomum dentatum TaxID=61180 RepID=A0A0B1S6V7_OESDE|nr:hypothetical protein OESDEN_19243 [Oesophagostomum dentatum]